MKARTFNIMQYENKPVTGESLNFTEKNILDGLKHRGIKRYAYIAHDRDKYMEEDVPRIKEKYGVDVAVGKRKEKHWHVVLDCPNQVQILSIAKWFGIPDRYIEVPKGHGAFLDCVAYLTHEDEAQQAMGKEVYSADEVKANFNWKAELEKRAERKLRYGKDLSDKDYYRSEVFSGRLTLRQLADENPIAYQNDYRALDSLRLKYINRAEMPKTRHNYYICGESGIGKGLMSRALARSLYQLMYDCVELPEYDDDVFFNVGTCRGSLLEGYDGQPIIIWHDRRAAGLIEELGGRENVFNVLDTHPAGGRHNVKYSSVSLINRVNIINGIEPYEDFINGLAGEEDITQSRRRVPYIVNLHDTDFDFLVNKGFADLTQNFAEYYEYKALTGNLKKIREKLSNYEELARQAESQIVQPIVEKHMEIEDKLNRQIEEDELKAIMAEFSDYGKQNVEAVEEEIRRLEIELLNLEQTEMSLLERIAETHYTFDSLFDEDIDDIRISEYDLAGVRYCPTKDETTKHRLKVDLVKLEKRLDEVSEKVDKVRAKLEGIRFI